MSNVTVGSSSILAEFGQWGTLLSSGGEARGASSKNRCQGESMCPLNGDGDFGQIFFLL